MAAEQVRMKRRTPNYDEGQIGVLGRRNAGAPRIRWVEFGVERHGSTGCWCGPEEYDLLPTSGSPLVPGIKCAGCNYSLDDSTHVQREGTRPTAGDLSICFNCGHLAIYVDAQIGLTLRELTPAEHEAALANPQVLYVLSNLIAFNEARRPKGPTE